jgi:1-acyl-sn-glycerol-3-phosphate acyltransferase
MPPSRRVAVARGGYGRSMLGSGLLGGSLTMAKAMAGDVARALDPLGLVDGSPPDDWLDARDPEYIRQVLPAIRAWSDVYFRAEVEGLEHVPEDEPALLVGNHSGGTLIADTFVFAQHFYDHFGAERAFHQLAHDLVFQVPGVRASLSRFGTVPASPGNMRAALGNGAALLVYPGGDHETYRPTWEQDQIDFAGRTGFAKLAIELGVPIVPVVAIGGQETALFLGQGQRISRLLGLARALRLKVFPVQLAPPLGVTLLDLPLRMPLPSKISIRVLPRIDLREELGADADPRQAYEIVTEQLQAELSLMAADRLLPVIG